MPMLRLRQCFFEMSSPNSGPAQPLTMPAHAWSKVCRHRGHGQQKEVHRPPTLPVPGAELPILPSFFVVEGSAESQQLRIRDHDICLHPGKLHRGRSPESPVPLKLCRVHSLKSHFSTKCSKHTWVATSLGRCYHCSAPLEPGKLGILVQVRQMSEGHSLPAGNHPISSNPCAWYDGVEMTEVLY